SPLMPRRPWPASSARKMEQPQARLRSMPQPSLRNLEPGPILGPGGLLRAHVQNGGHRQRVCDIRSSPTLLVGTKIDASPRQNPRKALAEWMVRHPYFAEAAVNRMWSYFFGRGLVDPVEV